VRREAAMHPLRLTVIALGGVVLLATARDAHAEVRYNITRLGDATVGFLNYASAINESGQIAGPGRLTGSPNERPAIYDVATGVTTNLGTLGGDGLGYAFDINDSGQVVGRSYRADGALHAFKFASGTMSDLGVLSGHAGSAALGINN